MLTMLTPPKTRNPAVDEKVIRALVIACGNQGASIEEIKRDYTEQIGGNLESWYDDCQLFTMLQNIPHITVKRISDQVKFFAGAPEQEHLVKLISKQRGSERNFRRKLNRTSLGLNDESLYGDLLDSSYFVRRSSLSSRRGGYFQQCGESIRKKSFKANQSIISQKSNLRHKADSEEDSDEHNMSNTTCRGLNVSRMSNMTFCDWMPDRDENRNPYVPEFYKCKLVGDYFFLQLAVKNLKFQMTPKQKVHQSGYCVSGMRIRDAAAMIENMESNQLILLNIGSTDIAEGRELIDMMYAMMDLYHACTENSITPIITTLLPMANYRLGSHLDIMNDFNVFLQKNPFEFPVIDLQKAFFLNDGSMNIDLFESCPKFVSGLRKPIVGWNRRGRLQVLQALKKDLGLALLKIISK